MKVVILAGGLGTSLTGGAGTQTGGRLKRLAPYVDDGTFVMTCCHGVADAGPAKLQTLHR